MFYTDIGYLYSTKYICYTRSFIMFNRYLCTLRQGFVFEKGLMKKKSAFCNVQKWWVLI